MITMCIRYTLDPFKFEDFERYARKLAGTHQALRRRTAGIFFAYEICGTDQYRACLDKLSRPGYL